MFMVSPRVMLVVVQTYGVCSGCVRGVEVWTFADAAGGRRRTVGGGTDSNLFKKTNQKKLAQLIWTALNPCGDDLSFHTLVVAWDVICAPDAVLCKGNAEPHKYLRGFCESHSHVNGPSGLSTPPMVFFSCSCFANLSVHDHLAAWWCTWAPAVSFVS